MISGLVIYLVMPVVVWRITHLISAEDGPFDVIFRVRKWLGSSFGGKLMDCFYCLSIWIGLLCAVMTGNHILMIILLGLFYSGIAILLEKLSNKHFS